MLCIPGPQLNPEQQAAVETALQVAADAGHMALIGPAGTGKTTTIRAIAHAVQRRHRKPVLLLAPTHKAVRQIQAAQLPRGVRSWTVARFCNVKPERWRDEDQFRSAGITLQMVETLQSGFSFVIVDESSMVTNEIADLIVAATTTAGIPVMFAGDPYQLPPVSKQRPEDYDEFADDGPEGAMASAFVDAPVISRLTRVMRHQGVILQFATAIREDWSQVHSFPVVARSDDDSEINLSSDIQADFIDTFELVAENAQSADDPLLFLYRNAPRALCYQNSTVATITKSLRERIYGGATTWQPNEIITFRNYTKTDRGFIHSSGDAIVIDVEIVDQPELVTSVQYRTPQRNLEKTLYLSFSGTFQRLTVRPIRPDGSPEPFDHVVTAPLCGDRAPIERYQKLKEALDARKFPARHHVWEWLTTQVKERYLAQIYSAFVMTVHKSQGSTFDRVFVNHDLLHAGENDRELRNALLYVAATRASKSITFGR